MKRKYVVASLVVASCVGLGISLINLSHAATPWLALESESGTLSSPAARLNDMTASGGAAISFDGPAITPTPMPAPSVAGVAIPANRLLYLSQSAQDSEMALLNDLGAKWLRLDFIWQDMEPTSQGSYNWANTDQVVASARAHGLQVDGIITTMPTWARGSGGTWQTGPTTIAQFTAYASFAKAVALHYNGKVSALEIWNEPNLDQFWSPTPSITAYAALIKAAYPAIKSVSTVTVLSGGTGGAGAAPDIQSITWYTGLYNNASKAYFDAAAVHPYNNLDAATSGEMAAADKIRTIMDSNGDTTKQLWGTEVGTPTGGSPAVSEANQALLVTGEYQHWATIHNAGPLFTYTLHDFSDDPTREGFFGLIRSDGTRKAAYAALKAWTASH